MVSENSAVPLVSENTTGSGDVWEIVCVSLFFSLRSGSRHLSGRKGIINIKHFNFSKKMSEGPPDALAVGFCQGKSDRASDISKTPPLPAVFS